MNTPTKVRFSNKLSPLEAGQGLVVFETLETQAPISEPIRKASETYKDPHRRREFCVSREVLLQVGSVLLGKRLSLEHIVTLSSGKPSFSNPEDQVLQFSITHTKKSVGLAFALKSSVGIDCEQLARFPCTLSRREHKWLHPYEIEQLQRRLNEQPSPGLAEILCSFWALKEAIAKRSGKGLALGFKSLNLFEDHNNLVLFKSKKDCVATCWPRDVKDLTVVGFSGEVVPLSELFQTDVQR